MKKNLISRFTVIIFTALCMLTTVNVFAGKHQSVTPTSTLQSAHEDIYTSYVQIYQSGAMADTPYVSFYSPPATVYSNVINVLSRQTGVFHVHIVFMNKEGEIVSEDDYDIDNS